jgi:hypothetical protein
MSIQKKRAGVWLIRWREGGRSRTLQVHGSHELAKKVERKKLSARDENRHLDVRREVKFRMTALIKRYRDEYATQKEVLYDREKGVLVGNPAGAWNPVCSRGGWLGRPALVPRSHGKEKAFSRHCRAALQRHAQHYGGGMHDLIEGNRD